jgi:hypothetical protein
MSNKIDVTDGAALGLVSFAVLEVFRTYKECAPPLPDIRTADRNDWTTKQQLVDANVLSGIIVVLMGVGAWVLIGKKWPLIFLALTWGSTAGYYYLVQQGPSSYDQLQDGV